MRSNDASARLGLIVDRWRRGKILRAKQLACQSLHCHQRMVNAKRVRFLHQLGLKVLVYTVNERQRARDLCQQGVDGLFTDELSLIL